MPDTSPQVEHADAAGWALGILNPDDSARFEAHLESCEECRQAVAEFGSAALLLTTPVPAMASVVGANRRPTCRPARWPGWNRPPGGTPGRLPGAGGVCD